MQITQFNSLGRRLRNFFRGAQIDTDNKFLLEFNSDGLLNLSGITDILEYDEDYILVESKQCITQISGQKLLLDTFNDKKIIVSGQVEDIKFIDR